MISYMKIHDLDRANPIEQQLSEMDAANLQLRLVHDNGAVILNSNARFIRYRAGAVEHVFSVPAPKREQRGLEGLGLFDDSLAGANQPSLF